MLKDQRREILQIRVGQRGNQAVMVRQNENTAEMRTAQIVALTMR